MARQSVSKYLDVLEGAALVTTVRRGREKLHYLNAEPINAIADRWINQYHRVRAQALADLETALEAEPMTDNRVRLYHLHPHHAGKTVAGVDGSGLHRSLLGSAARLGLGGRFSDGLGGERGEDRRPRAGRLRGAAPPRRLAYTWHTLTPEFAAAHGFDDEFVAKVGKEHRSKVTFDIEPHRQVVKLTVIHDGFDPGSVVLENVSHGWPGLLSNLKTLLETGETLPQLASQQTAR